jgi:hypothetical protein
VIELFICAICFIAPFSTKHFLHLLIPIRSMSLKLRGAASCNEGARHKMENVTIGIKCCKHYELKATIICKMKCTSVSNSERCSLTDQVLGLLSRSYQFESHKPQGHYRVTWSLTSGPVRLVELRAS